MGARMDKGTEGARKLTLRWGRLVDLRRRCDSQAVHVLMDQLDRDERRKCNDPGHQV